jgi:hypothetical protein
VRAQSALAVDNMQAPFERSTTKQQWTSNGKKLKSFGKL